MPKIQQPMSHIFQSDVNAKNYWFFLHTVARWLYSQWHYSLVCWNISSRPNLAIYLMLYQCNFDPTESFWFSSIGSNVDLGKAILIQCLSYDCVFRSVFLKETVAANNFKNMSIGILLLVFRSPSFMHINEKFPL